MMRTLTTQLTILPDGEDLFSERATMVQVEDKAGGPFIVIRQVNGRKEEAVRIDPTEWPDIVRAVGTILATCEALEK